ncbi:MAG TPA: hypothetical protein VGQ64_07960 [Candidatus Limnocylindrales bacterium]|nr:hypothetical protein [Candidatus Limnocylindrales bacterium]
MPYPALPDHRIAYDIDGSVVGYQLNHTGSATVAFAAGIEAYLSPSDVIELNDVDYDALSVSLIGDWRAHWIFFPERREVTAAYFGFSNPDQPVPSGGTVGVTILQGSNDSTSGVDGTWETASFPAGVGQGPKSLDGWRSTIKAVSFTGGKKVLRFAMSIPFATTQLRQVHLYGEKFAGQTPNDVVFIDPDTGNEFATALDFGDRPLGTTVVDTFKVKNVSGSQTANSVNVQCNDPDFVISDSASGPWVVTYNISSLAAGASSITLYVKNTTPNPGALLGPRFARITAIVGSWS